MKHPQDRDPRERFNSAWPRLSWWRRTSLLVRIYCKLGEVLIRRLRPIDLILPVCLAEFALFMLAIWLPSDQVFIDLGIGNIIIAGFVMLPSVFDRRRKQYVYIVNERRSEY